MAVHHLAQAAVDHETIALLAEAGLYGVQAVPVIAGVGQGGGQAAFGQLRQPACLLRLVASQQQRRSGQAGRGEKGRTEQAPAHLLQQDGQLDEAQAEAAVLLGDMDGRPDHLAAQSPPEHRVMTQLGSHGRTHGGGIGYIREKALGGLADHLLLIAEREFHKAAFW
ncbi:hypothetical protein D3C85_1166270 [compost metagenome]